MKRALGEQQPEIGEASRLPFSYFFFLQKKEISL